MPKLYQVLYLHYSPLPNKRGGGGGGGGDASRFLTFFPPEDAY